MKIAIVSSTGSVGKTTLAVNLFAPRMPGAAILSVESINESAAELGAEAEKVRGNEMMAIMERVMSSPSVIVDVGASNIEAFLVQLGRFKAAHAEFDYFIIPVVGRAKEQQEALNLVRTLAAMKIPRRKIKALFNYVERDVEDEFETFIGARPACDINLNAVVESNEVFNLLGQYRTSIAAVLADKTDWKALIKSVDRHKEPEKLHEYVEMWSMRQLADSAKDQFDLVWNALFDAPKSSGATAEATA